MFDDGNVTFWKMKNMAAEGDLPNRQPTLYSKMAFDYKAMGFQNYETAKQTGDQIDITIVCWQDIDLCKSARQFQASFDDENDKDGKATVYYRVKMAQPFVGDLDGLKQMRIYLERIADDE